MNAYTVYILYSATADRYYVGHTSDIDRRIKEHNDPLANSSKYSAKNGPWILQHKEDGFVGRADAMRREKLIKSWKSRKKIEQLIKGESSVGIPTCRD